MERTALLIDQRAVLETSVELSVGDTVACRSSGMACGRISRR